LSVEEFHNAPKLRRDDVRHEHQADATVSLTSAGAAALGNPFRAGSKFGTVQIFATIGA
jgi:hypothetical protein